MKACLTSCLILMLLSLTPRACGGSGPEPTLVASTQEQAQKLARRHLDAGVALHESGRFADAVPEYDLALRLYPHYDEAYMNRGMAYAQLDENQRAIQDFEQAVRLNPNLPGVYAGWGRPMLSGGSVMTMSLRGRKPGKGSNTSMTMVRRHMRSIPVRPSTTVRQCSCAEISSKTGRSRSSAKITQIISPMLRKIRP